MSISCSITGISWERVHLTVTATLSVESNRTGRALPSGIDIFGDDVEFTIVDTDRSFPVLTTRVGIGVYRLDINITNFRSRAQVPDVTWRIVAIIAGEAGPTARYDLTDLDQLEQDSRTFLYAGNRTSYIVRFGISESDDAPEFLMRTYQMFRSPKLASPADKPAALKRIRKYALNRTFDRARRVLLANRYYALARRLDPPRGNRILFASEMRSG